MLLLLFLLLEWTMKPESHVEFRGTHHDQERPSKQTVSVDSQNAVVISFGGTYLATYIQVGTVGNRM